MIIDWEGPEVGMGLLDFGTDTPSTPARYCVHIDSTLTTEVAISSRLVNTVELTSEAC